MKRSTSSNYYTNNSPKRVRHQLSALSIQHQGKSSIASEILKPQIKKSKLIVLRERHHPESDKIDPNLAQIVLSTYIVRLFRDQKQETLSRSRSTAYGFKKTPLKQNILKLSDQIKEVLDSTNSYLLDLKQALDDKQKETASLKSCLDTTTQLLLKHSSNITTIKFNWQETIHHQKIEENKQSFAVREKFELQNSFAKLWSSTEQIMIELYNKRSNNISLKESSQQYHHWHLSYVMKGATVGERLKGLYLGYINLTVPSNLEGIFGSIVTGFLDCSRELYKKEARDIAMVDVVMPSVISLMKNAHYSFYLRNNMMSDIKRVRTLIIGKITNVAQSIVSNNQENDGLLRSHSTLERKLEGFTEEYERARVKLLESAALDKKNNLLTEKVCGNCSKVFTEENNFNWSCKTHSGLWGGNMYWCCGETEQDSLGCQKSKHKSKEDNEEADDTQGNEKSVKNENFCASCHKIGHSSLNCGLDPNSPTKSISVENTIKKSASQISLDKIFEIYSKKKKWYKIVKNSSKISDLKESLTQKVSRKPTKIKRQKIEKRESVTPGILNPLINTLESSAITDSFPRISSRKVSSSLNRSNSSGKSLNTDISSI